VYVCGQLEKGENGTPHIQYFVNISAPRGLTYMKNIQKETHWEIVRVNKAA